MRRYIRIGLLATGALLALLAGCKPQLTSFDAGNYIGGTATAAATVRDNLSAGQLEEYRDGLAVPATALSGGVVTPGALSPLPGQRFSLNFYNGVIDADTIATGMVLYPLEAAADSDGAYSRGSALPLTLVAVLPDGLGGCAVVVDVDLDGTTVSSVLELELNAELLTANGGTNRLNDDGDGLIGEADEDDRLEYITVVGAPVAAAGTMRSPQNTITIGLPDLSVGDTTVVQSVRNSEGGTTEMTVASLTAGWVWRVFEPTLGTWSTVTPTPVYDDVTGELTWTFPAAFARGSLYRFEIDMYQSAESESVSGYIHRMSFDQGDPDERYDYGYMGAVRTPAFANVAASGPVVHGTTDLTGGFDWATTPQDFWISRNGAAAVHVQLSTNANSLNDIVTVLDAALDAATGGDDYDVAAEDYLLDGGDDAVRIYGVATGSDEYFTLSVGTTSDALQGLGLAIGTYVGRDAWTGTVTGVLRSPESSTDYARWIEVNFAVPVDVDSITPDSLVVVKSDGTIAPWEETGLIALTETRVRIGFPSSFQGNGTYHVRVYPSVLDADGVPFADTSVEGSRSSIGAKADSPYLESATWNWN